MSRWIVGWVIAGVLSASDLILADEPQPAGEVGGHSAVRPADLSGVRQTLANIGEVLTARISVDFDSSPWSKDADVIAASVNSRYDLKTPFAIRVDQRDLQQAGITKNALARRFKVKDTSVADVLTQWVIFHNPISTVWQPSEEDQKLVWVIAPDKKSILITTRHAAAKKPYDLPMRFRLK